jgi:hypothetical protein
MREKQHNRRQKKGLVIGLGVAINADKKLARERKWEGLLKIFSNFKIKFS